VNIDLIASSGGAVAFDTAPVSWNLPILGYDGIERASGDDIIGLDAAQFSLLAPPVRTPGWRPGLATPVVQNHFVITTFTIRMTASSSFSYRTRTSSFGTIAAFTISDTAVPAANPARFGVGSVPARSFLILCGCLCRSGRCCWVLRGFFLLVGGGVQA
jgi:hypothetical protein